MSDVISLSRTLKDLSVEAYSFNTRTTSCKIVMFIIFIYVSAARPYNTDEINTVL